MSQDDKRTVLVIDDSDIARASLRQLLEGGGYAVAELASAIGATREILRSGVSIVVVDVSMPGLSGDKLVKLLRDNPRLERLIVVVISARAPEELEKIAQNTPADGVLAKDEANKRLLPLLEKLLTRRTASRTQTERRSDPVGANWPRTV
jgi:CheY-like chemotaxis protein